ncbi:MAG: hypothetical protein AVDCRST_MAG15-2919, partial [uncultured Rubellimicrobium sp.]
DHQHDPTTHVRALGGDPHSPRAPRRRLYEACGDGHLSVFRRCRPGRARHVLALHAGHLPQLASRRGRGRAEALGRGNSGPRARGREL